MAYPSVVSTFSNPNATDKLNSPSHSSIETAQNTDLTALETFVGTLSSTAGTLMYDIRAAASSGGGHVQGVNKGGTGQTGYTKGDVLVASSSSVLSKLTVGSDGFFIQADSTQASGLKWNSVLGENKGGTGNSAYTKGDILAANSSSVLSKIAIGADGQVLAVNSSVTGGVNWTSANSNKIATNSSIQSFGVSTVAEVSILSVNIPGSTLGSNNAINARIFISDMQVNTPGTDSILLNINYGSATAAGYIIKNPLTTTSGEIGVAVVASTVSAQRIFSQINFSHDSTGSNDFGYVHSVMSQSNSATVAVESSANQNLGATVKFSSSSANNYIKMAGYIIEKIV